ncbi:molybdopterin synthase catalytic subunit MoaE [Gammaproteobacteria bacterium]|jgi:molybdopterin synthase catalytic subunit|nr:molybdopterin synthase catalytic subunit MoaE [Gammaproteobacteria bacterium]
MKISIQQNDFDIAKETQLLRDSNSNTGAIVTFSGLVRDLDKERKVESLILEHYPGMTESSLEKIIAEAQSRWSVLDVTVIHRIGELHAGEQIVFVAVASLHRGEAFSACEFIMDFLKTRAPFWKKCRDENGESWVEAKATDEDASARW